MKPMQRIDAHQHFWQLDRQDYRWLTSDLSELYRDYLPEHLTGLMSQGNVEKTILIQAADSLDETYFMMKLANQHEFIAGVVGWIDMLAYDAVEQLQRLSQQPKFKGIRPMLQDLSDPAWILNDAFAPIFQALIDNNLSFDALVKTEHLPYLEQLIKRYPHLKVVINHGAKPDIASGKTQAWSDLIRSIAQNPNVYCKLSGLVTEAGIHNNYVHIFPYMQHLFECFGSSRLMFGSDWPVLNLASDYPRWITYVEHFVQAMTPAQQQAIWNNNAATFYNLTL
ncbi:amidohydrolase family protein [Alteromonas sp. 14N.309.X.WAT.G.H12]|uniref:amidohydrolase family protein n=1 Tax=Alteromonas sp. 14N.309.X.WAT.G.H12 TaxID=3120824 RepID=UPI002FCFF97B